MSVTWSCSENYAKLKLDQSGFLHPAVLHENRGLRQHPCISALSCSAAGERGSSWLRLQREVWQTISWLLCPHHICTRCLPVTPAQGADTRTRLSLRPGWATDSKTLSRGKTKTLVIMISEHSLSVNTSQKLRKESNFTLVLGWDNWPINNQGSTKEREEPLSRLPV